MRLNPLTRAKKAFTNKGEVWIQRKTLGAPLGARTLGVQKWPPWNDFSIDSLILSAVTIRRTVSIDRKVTR